MYNSENMGEEYVSDSNYETHIDEEEQSPEWDEGGPSHCGYHETVHDTMMAVGRSVHSVVGDPSPQVEENVIQSVGTWFQEASYAVRDFLRGNHEEVGDDASHTLQSMKKSAMEGVSEMFGNGSEQNDAPMSPANSSRLPVQP